MGKLLTIGMAVPLDSKTIAELAELTGLRVKAVYCRPDHILGAINRYYRKEEAAALGEFQDVYGLARGSSTMVNIAGLLKGIDDLPTLPETVRKTKEALDDPNVAMEEVEAFIGSDPLVSTKLLKLANSAAFKFSRRIDDVGMAIRLLGLQETYSMVLASSVLSMAENAKGFDFQRFWNEALFTAAAVPEVAATVGVRPSSAMSTAGLLHDIGRFALAQVSAANYGQIDRRLVGYELVDVEEEALGLGHPEAGYVVAEHWDLPEEITTLIRFHHAPETADGLQAEARIVSMAAFLSEAHTNKDILKDKKCLEEVREALGLLGMPAEKLLEIFRDLNSTFAA
jgi:HD-like signal output (HDOD) protein